MHTDYEIKDDIDENVFVVCRDKQDNVMKILYKNKRDPRIEQVYKNEVKYLTMLSANSSVVRIVNYFDDVDTYYIEMAYLQDYVNMDTMDTIISKDLVKIIVNIYKGILTIHNANVAHGDIHGGNIMIHPKTLDVKYIDFQHADTLTDKNKNVDLERLLNVIHVLLSNNGIKMDESINKIHLSLHKIFCCNDKYDAEKIITLLT